MNILPTSRRRFLQAGGIGALNLAIPGLVVGKDKLDDAGKAVASKKRCIFLLLCGGPSQLDTWDLKPDAPSETYSVGSITFNPFTETDNYTSADANFNAYKGTGTVPLYLTNTFGATPTATGSGITTSWLTSITGSTTGNLHVTYTYDAAPPIAPVPEPPAVLLGFGGLLGLVGFAFKRRMPPPVAAAALA